MDRACTQVASSMASKCVHTQKYVRFYTKTRHSELCVSSCWRCVPKSAAWRNMIHARDGANHHINQNGVYIYIYVYTYIFILDARGRRTRRPRVYFVYLFVYGGGARVSTAHWIVRLCAYYMFTQWLFFVCFSESVAAPCMTALGAQAYMLYIYHIYNCT